MQLKFFFYFVVDFKINQKTKTLIDNFHCQVWISPGILDSGWHEGRSGSELFSFSRIDGKYNFRSILQVNSTINAERKKTFKNARIERSSLSLIKYTSFHSIKQLKKSFYAALNSLEDDDFTEPKNYFLRI